MKKLWFTMTLGMAVLLCTACVMTAGPRGSTVTIAPPLPVIVELLDPFYFFGGFHYYYRDNRWYYSQHKDGPWIDLPRDRYPKEVRQRGRGHGHDKDRGPGRGHDRY